MALAGLAMIALSGCVVHDRSADITFQWDFAGLDCISAGVNRTTVDVWNGNVLEASSTVACDASGVTLTNFEPGWYNFDLQGISPSGAVLYGSSGSVNLSSGNNVVNVSMQFTGG
jgi:hypothetical protein